MSYFLKCGLIVLLFFSNSSFVWAISDLERETIKRNYKNARKTFDEIYNGPGTSGEGAPFAQHGYRERLNVPKKIQKLAINQLEQAERDLSCLAPWEQLEVMYGEDESDEIVLIGSRCNSLVPELELTVMIQKRVEHVGVLLALLNVQTNRAVRMVSAPRLPPRSWQNTTREKKRYEAVSRLQVQMTKLLAYSPQVASLPEGVGIANAVNTFAKDKAWREYFDKKESVSASAYGKLTRGVGCLIGAMVRVVERERKCREAATK